MKTANRARSQRWRNGHRLVISTGKFKRLLKLKWKRFIAEIESRDWCPKEKG